MMRYPRRLTCLVAVLSILSATPLSANEPVKRVLILPLTIHSEKDLTFLNPGIMDMMASRISRSATVLRGGPVKPGSDPVEMGRKLKADYVVSGSLTLFGDNLSTDAALTAVDSREAVLHFSQFSQNSGDVLLHVNQFATQVGQHIDALSAPSPRLPSPAPPAPIVAPSPAVPAVEPTAQPAMPPPATAPPTADATEPADAPAEIAPLAAVVQPDHAPWISRPIKGTISGLTTGDVNGDGRMDIIFVHENQIVVEDLAGQRLHRIVAFDAGRRHSIISVDAGDFNGNSVTEIFVTRLDARSRLDSVVLEWNGSGLHSIASGQSWYFAVTEDPEDGRILMGQRQDVPEAIDAGGMYTPTHFLPGVFELSWAGREIHAGRRFALPAEINLYRFARGDLFNDGKTRTIAYSASDQLRVYDSTGSPEWAGQETLGGNPMFLESPSVTDSRTTDHTYLPQRLIAADLDGDGKVEVLTVHNRDATRGLVERFRKYTRGRLVALRWNRISMQEVWSGEEISGYISGFSLADLNGDGQLEAVSAMVSSTGLAQTKSSHVVVEPMADLSEK